MITDIDPNPDNFVSAGIVNTTAVLVGCLVRLEPNKQTKVRVCRCVCVGHFQKKCELLVGVLSNSGLFS